jgi:hypothetical protein
MHGFSAKYTLSACYSLQTLVKGHPMNRKTHAIIHIVLQGGMGVYCN